MEELGKIYQLIVPFSGHSFSFNLRVIATTWGIMLSILLFGIVSTRKSQIVPSSAQIITEILVTKLFSLTEDALGKKLSKTYSPMICALFIFLLICNWVGIIPHMEEPTKDLNTPLSLGILGFVIAHYVGIKTKGFKNYAKEYFQPFFIMMPLNLIGELAKIISISFRLFGNIMGGSIIILVVSYLTYSLILPPFLNLFFGLFVGTIQAFVFTMITIVYISVQAK